MTGGPAVTLVLGGARSGKSAYAEALLGGGTYLATATAGDAEMAARIAAHRARRGQAWRTVEEPLELAAALAKCEGPVLVDCLTLWLTNIMQTGRNVDAQTQALVAALQDIDRIGIDRTHDQSRESALHVKARADSPAWRIAEGDSTQPGSGLAGPVVLVSNEVGQGIVPDNALAREFRDRAGRLNQEVAAVAGRVVLVAAGLPLVLKGEK